MANWRKKLAYIVYARDGTELKTLRDASEYALGLPDGEQLRPEWQHAAALLIAAAAGGDVEAATHQVKAALFLNAKLDVKRTPPRA
jgi:hypothetical protein